MLLLHSVPVLHNHLLIALILIVLGFLGILLQRNALSTVFSLFIWLQGAGLVFTSYGQYQSSREGDLYFLIILFFVIILLCTLAFLIFSLRHSMQHKNPKRNPDESQVAPITQAGTRARE